MALKWYTTCRSVKGLRNFCNRKVVFQKLYFPCLGICVLRSFLNIIPSKDEAHLKPYSTAISPFPVLRNMSYVSRKQLKCTVSFKAPSSSQCTRAQYSSQKKSDLKILPYLSYCTGDRCTYSNMDYVNYSLGILYNRLITLLLYQEANIAVWFQKGSQN